MDSVTLLIIIICHVSSISASSELFIRRITPSDTVSPRKNCSQVVLEVEGITVCAVMCLDDPDCPAFWMRGSSCELLTYSGNQQYKWTALPTEVIYMEIEEVCIFFYKYANRSVHCIVMLYYSERDESVLRM